MLDNRQHRRQNHPVQPGALLESDQLRLGIDLVDTDEIAESIARYGDRYLSRVYTEHELMSCELTSASTADHLAARFAAKEAVFKALRPADGVSLRDIEILTDADGTATVGLTGSIERHARSIGVVDSRLTLSHHNGAASAIYLAVLNPDPSRNHHHGPTH